MKPTAWRRLGKYVLLGRLGAGGMGKIYLAHAPGPAGIDKLLIVKRLHGHLTGDPVLVTSFLDEARLSMALNHPHIVHTYDVGELDGRYFMVMEYIDGQNLGVLLRTAKRSGQYPPSTLWAGLFSGVLEGLHAAHVARDARGRPLQIIHRDVSPQNVLVTYEGTPKLVDFGIAKAAMRVGETDAGTLKGKYAYMSPEQVRGEPLDPRSDVFAAGVVLWEMLAGRRLYKADTIVRSVERILKEEPVSPQRVNPDVDERLAAVCTKALDKVRERRFASAEAMKEALEDALVAMGHRHRAVDVRELMQRLFSDVIDKQRAMLEATLNATGEVAEIDDDDPRPRRTADSQSDLRMRQLHVAAAVDHETTTPSALHRSPLVTEEDAARAVEPSALPLDPAAPASPAPAATPWADPFAPADPGPPHWSSSMPSSSALWAAVDGDAARFDAAPSPPSPSSSFDPPASSSFDPSVSSPSSSSFDPPASPSSLFAPSGLSLALDRPAPWSSPSSSFDPPASLSSFAPSGLSLDLDRRAPWSSPSSSFDPPASPSPSFAPSGLSLELDRPAPAPAPPATAADHGCPKCGWARATGATECGRCGLIFARYVAQQARTPTASSSPDEPWAPTASARPTTFDVAAAVGAVTRGWSSALSELPSVFFFNLVPSVTVFGLTIGFALGALTAARAGAGLPVVLIGLFAIIMAARVSAACVAGSLLVLDDHASGGLASRGFSDAFAEGWSMGSRVAVTLWLFALLLALPFVPAMMFLVRKELASVLLTAPLGLVGFFVVGMRSLFVVPAAVLGGEGPFDALQTSWDLTRGRAGAMVVALGFTGAAWFLLVLLGGLARHIPWVGFFAGVAGTTLATAFALGAVVHLWRAASAAGPRE